MNWALENKFDILSHLVFWVNSLEEEKIFILQKRAVRLMCKFLPSTLCKVLFKTMGILLLNVGIKGCLSQLLNRVYMIWPNINMLLLLWKDAEKFVGQTKTKVKEDGLDKVQLNA